jgi:hypothetical protein
MGKFTKKLKKGLKKAAPLIMAGLAAKAMMGRGKKYNTSPVSVDSGRGSNIRGILKSRMPDHLSHSMGPYRDNTGEGAYTLADDKWNNWSGSYMPLKKGGRVRGAGKAKRGFGRALKKGK